MNKLYKAFKILFFEFKKYIIPYKWRYIFSTLAILLNIPFSLANSRSREILMTAIENASRDELLFWFYVFAGVLFALLIVTQIGRTILYYCESYSTADFASDGFNIICRLPMSYVSKLKSADVARRINKDTIITFQGIVRTLIYIFYESVLPFFGFFMLALVNIYIALTAVIAAPIVMAVSTSFRSKIKRVAKKSMEHTGIISSFVQEGISNMAVIRAFNRCGYFLGLFNEKIRANAAIKKKRAIIEASMFASVNLVSETLSVATVFAICIAAFKGSINVAVVLSSLYLLSLISDPFRTIAYYFGNTVEGIAAKERVFDVIKNEVELKKRDINFADTLYDHSLEFNNVSFSYETNGDKATGKVLDGVSFKVKKGERIAIVGASGGGKSTIAKLCCALYAPDEGDVMVCGINTTDDIYGVRKKISYVPQIPYLFKGTILENIAYGGDEASFEKIEKTAERANAAEFILGFNDKYNHDVGEGGTLLSGGERQRVSLARAMLKDSPIFIFDEATSSLDNKSESLIQEAIGKIGKDKTVLIIAHRLSTIKNADRIIVIDGGKICEEGTHDELLTKNGKYRTLYET